MPIRKRSESFSEYYGLVEDIIEPEPDNGYSRSFFLLDCVDAKRFRESGAAALADTSALALVRAMSTPTRWMDRFGFAEPPKGEWIAFTLDDSGDAPRAWELPAGQNYRSGPVRSVRSMRRLGDGSATASEGGGNMELAVSLTAASAWGRSGRQVMAVDAFIDRLAGRGDEDIEIIALDVGQASAALIKQDGRAIGLFDAGAPIWFNKGSLALGFEPPAIATGFIFLSHWDFDHFDLGRRHTPYRNLDWYAPDQPVGPNAAKFQVDLGAKLALVDGTISRGGFTLTRGTSTLPNDRNGSGYQLRYEKHGSAVLLTGDADYALVPPHMLIDLARVSIPHHAGRATSPPAPLGSAARAIASYGSPNSYRHPHATTIAAHARLGWEVLPTAAGVLPRGDRPLYP